MEKVKVLVGWSENNYSAVCDSINGVVIDTNKDLEELKKSFAEVFKFHVEESLEDGDKLPDYIVAGDYELEFETKDYEVGLVAFEKLLEENHIAKNPAKPKIARAVEYSKR